MYIEADYINTCSTNHINFLNHEDPKVEPGVFHQRGKKSGGSSSEIKFGPCGLNLCLAHLCPKEGAFLPEIPGVS